MPTDRVKFNTPSPAASLQPATQDLWLRASREYRTHTVNCVACRWREGCQTGDDLKARSIVAFRILETLNETDTPRVVVGIGIGLGLSALMFGIGFAIMRRLLGAI